MVRDKSPSRLLWYNEWMRIAAHSTQQAASSDELDLDQGLLLLAGEATEAVEALALAITVVEAAVGALSKLGEVAEVGVVVNLAHGVGGGASDAAGHGEGASAALGNVDLEEVLDSGLAGEVGELDGEVHVVASGGEGGVGELAEVGGVLGVLVVANVVVLEGRKVLDAVVEAVADGGGAGGASDLDALKNLVGKGAESVLDTGGSDVVVGRAVNSVSAPDAAIGVVVDHEELLGDEGGGALAVDLDGLLHHVALNSGERIVAVGGDAVGAVGAVVAEVAFAALDLAM